MRDAVLTALVDRALSDESFRSRAMTDLDGALADAGFDLEPDELEAAHEFQAQVAGGSDVDVQRAIRQGAG